MKDEIKEISEKLNYYKTLGKEPTYCEELITTGELYTLLDYITTLQEENERLKSFMKRAEDRLIEIENKYGYILDDVVYLLMRGSDKE